MNNIISVSGGNDSIAMLLVINRLRQQDSDFFKNDTWSCVYFNTGWARDGWEKRIDIVKRLCDKFGFKFHELRSSAINEHIKTDRDLCITHNLSFSFQLLQFFKKDVQKFFIFSIKT